ncbi:MAG TPA: sulfite exporter TauE/SafE family protein [Phycisphaerae bacterium]|nr:sulfite exporter TauE/SafE family protein [Phycisphaerae bacterium]
MIALVVTIFAASIFGSLHCAGMCGAFVLFAIGAGESSVATSRTRLMAVYHAGRLMTYVALGGLAGEVGSVVDFAGYLVGIQRAATVAAGALVVGFGSVTLLRLSGFKIAPLKLPGAMQAVVTKLHRRSMALSPTGRALATGLLTTLLPCGWLYAFVVTAAGTANPAAGALVMGAFWVGTLPALTVLGMGIQRTSAPLAKRLPFITAAAVVSIGIYTIVARAHVTIVPHAVQQASTGSLVEQVRSIDQSKLPCCSTRPEGK